ncbi:hypothetical protein ACKLNO_07625 [Neisseriaceae bacterium B1]
MNAIAKQNIDFIAQTPLRDICLITDGNQHRSDLMRKHIDFTHEDLASEAMLPEIRTVATLIAAVRHDFSQACPTQFTEEADWFAARIIVLQARVFHLEVSLKPMLDIANRRAQAFAQAHRLAFQAAKIRPSLHAHRPANMLLIQCALNGEACNNLFENSSNLRKLCVKPM